MCSDRGFVARERVPGRAVDRRFGAGNCFPWPRPKRRFGVWKVPFACVFWCFVGNDVCVHELETGTIPRAASLATATRHPRAFPCCIYVQLRRSAKTSSS